MNSSLAYSLKLLCISVSQNSYNNVLMKIRVSLLPQAHYFHVMQQAAESVRRPSASPAT